MKTAIVTIVSGDLYKKIWEISGPLFDAYASRIGAELVVFSNTSGLKIPNYKKRDVGLLLEKYDRVAYIDADILIRQDAPSIFEVVPEDSLGAFEEGLFFPDRASAMLSFASGHRGKTMSYPALDSWLKSGKYYNTGVMVCSKIHSQAFLDLDYEIDNFAEQTFLNYNFHYHGYKIFNIHHKFNRMYWIDKVTGESRFDSYFLHYAGLAANLGEGLINRMRLDAEEWKSGIKDYYPKNILLRVYGGLGDQISVEPIVRACREKLFKRDNIVVTSHFPELFKHHDVVSQHHDDPFNDVGFYEMRTLSSEAPFRHCMFHPLDYSSFVSIKTQLSGMERKVTLPHLPLPNGFTQKSLRNTVLIHAGRGWSSKTFPAKFWEMVVGLVRKAGLDPLLIGRDEVDGYFGTVKLGVDVPSVVNMTTVEEMIALCQRARALISNDSSPVHAAGASGTPVGLISIAKRPEHIMPYGSIYQNIVKKMLPFNSAPNQVYARIDIASEKEVEECLPSASDIALFLEHYCR